MELVLNLRASLAEDTSRFKQRSAKPRGECPKRLTLTDGSRLGHAIEIRGWHELGVHGEGCRLWQVQLSDLLSHITRDELDGRLHFWHDALGFRKALQAALAEPFVLRHRPYLRDVLVDICGNELAIATYPAFEVNKMVVVADGTNVLLDLCALLDQALVLTPRCVEHPTTSYAPLAQ
jgi:hypothetical protein